MKTETVKNWAGNVEFQPSTVAHPSSTNELTKLILQAKSSQKKLRVIGSGHSFTRLIETNDILVSLDLMQGLISHDDKNVRVMAGTKLKRLGEELHALGLGLENLGDIDVQSLAGALSTGTHGTGVNLGVISTQALALKFINGQGETITCSAQENPDVFSAARVSLGALGVITEATLRTEPRYKLSMVQEKASLDSALENFASYNRTSRHFEFFWFPHSKTVLQKLTQLTDEEPLPITRSQHFTEVILENTLFEGISKISRTFPKLAPSVSRLCGSLVSSNRRQDWSHKVFASPRWVKFVEMEYGVPLKHFKDVIGEIEKNLADERHEVHFPIECRFVKGDEIWMSPAYGEDRAFISVHMYRGMPYQKYFAAMEKIFLKFGGRPHWGKLHSLRAKDLETLYPRWTDFQKQRRLMDPSGVFETAYLKSLWS